MAGRSPSAINLSANQSTIGVFPVPPTVRLPTLITVPFSRRRASSPCPYKLTRRRAASSYPTLRGHNAARSPPPRRRRGGRAPPSGHGRPAKKTRGAPRSHRPNSPRLSDHHPPPAPAGRPPHPPRRCSVIQRKCASPDHLPPRLLDQPACF